MVNRDDVKKAMNVLGITDIHVELTYVKKVHKRLLIRWHPDSCPEGMVEEYTKKSAEINSAFDVLVEAYDLGLMGPGAEDFSETSKGGETDKAKAGNNHQSNAGYNAYSYYEDVIMRERSAYKRRYNKYLFHNGIWNFIFYAICIRYIYGTLTEVDLELKNILIKETPYVLSLYIIIFYLLKSVYVVLVVDGGESELMFDFCRIYIPIAFVFPIVYLFMHSTKAAIVFLIYFAVWAVFEWIMDIKVYDKLDVMRIEIIKGKKISLPLIFFTVEELIVIAFGIYVAIAAIYIK